MTSFCYRIGGSGRDMETGLEHRIKTVETPVAAAILAIRHTFPGYPRILALP
jgi:hypothetical protein